MKNTLLRLERMRKSWTQQQLADFAEVSLSTIERAERGEPIRVDSIQRICSCLNKSPEELGLLKTGIPLEDITGSLNPEDNDMHRRKALQLLGITGSSLIISTSSATIDLDELETLFSRKLARLQEWVLEGLEDGTRLRWQLYYTSGNTLTEDGLRNQIIKLEQLADEGGPAHAKICRVLAQNYQLAGSLARDKFHYTMALDQFHKAHIAAEESQSFDMVATAVARQGLALLRQENVEKALALYRNACQIAVKADPLTKAYVTSGLAEALARNGLRDECYRTLDQAELLFERAQGVPLEEDFSYVRLSLQSLEDSRGECYVLLGEPLKGLEYLQTAAESLDQKISRNYCRLLMQQAEAFLVAEQPDLCVQYALQGLQIARMIESTSNINWSREVYMKLRTSKWKNEGVVSELKAAIDA
ncbi:hypothetical protein KSD_62020 [Ktedonobacter sp. SOSP1-85]|uniref:helix-turn-helix domain-containing protein n=1 Tax=Ktedonobacter sp. SOSP1-85 TaxID=2778367 RepID=UPI00191605A2|nr:helix-turn-helix transcriptional regulator [Ktedonobacter sp. SOSP1-85]GHO78431.1 hypothetical protein KSD_62020 [Ktedonobacter sp. SOSP1-85]